jgi:hypothetical protein
MTSSCAQLPHFAKVSKVLLIAILYLSHCTNLSISGSQTHSRDRFELPSVYIHLLFDGLGNRSPAGPLGFSLYRNSLLCIAWHRLPLPGNIYCH